MAADQVPAGRRERKKLETREALRAAGRRLFAEQGVVATSVEQITEAADVSERTFFRYFESKYDLLLPDLTALFAAIEAELARRAADEHPLEAFRAAVVLAVGSHADSGTGLTMMVPGLDPTDPAVTSRLARAFVAWEERLTDLFEQRLPAGTHPDQAELRAATLAGVAVAGTRAVVRLMRRHPDLPPARRRQLLDEAFDYIRRGCDEAPSGGPHGPRRDPAR